MVNKKQLAEDMAKRFQQIIGYDGKVGLNEMTYLSQMANEADNDQENPGGEDPNAAGGAPDMGGDPNAMGGAPDMGGDPNAMGGAPDMGDDPNAMGGDPNAVGGDPSMEADPNAMDGGVQTPEGLNPQDPAMGAEGGDLNSGDFEQPGDEVLDVTELTDKQDDIEKEVSEVGEKFDKVIKAIGAFEELLRANDEKIEDLKTEFERRNPTQIEKLSMQTAKSYPFNVTPEEFWKEKEATSNYSTEDDDNGKEQGQYTITANDVMGDTNWKGISDSLDDDDFMYHQTLDKIMRV